MGIFNFLKSNSEHRKSIRVNTNIGDKYININLGQTYESMDILSLKIFQKDLYRLFDADYGIIVGRVLGQGVGIPNAKVSVFIPLDEEDITSPTTLEDIKKIEATALYPFQTVFDKDGNGKVYNLLPKYARNRNVNGFPDNPYGIGATPKTPVGTFPEKDEILVNETVAYVYDKYLKYTTVTNESGDYILTVPANKSYNVNMSCDITDIGRFSTCAALLKLDGYPDNFFSEDGRTLNEEIELERLPNIDIQNNSITVKPLWSQNISNSNVGINRLDFNLVKKIKPFVTIIGNQFTQNSRAWWGDKIQFRFVIGIRALCFDILGVNVKIDYVVPFFAIRLFVRKMCTLNGGKGDYEPFEMKFVDAGKLCTKSEGLQAITEGMTDDIFIDSHVKGDLDIKLFNIKNTVTESDAQMLNGETKLNIDNADPIFDNYSYNTDIELYDINKYIYYQNEGSFIFLLNCNRNKVITNENGDLIPVDDKSEKGVFTSFRGYFYVTNLSDVDNPPTRYRVGKVRLKVPQFFDYAETNKWIWKHFKFDFGKIYSVAQKTMVRKPEFESNTEGEDDYTVGENQDKGFASQTNLLLFGSREVDVNVDINNRLQNYNTGYTNYINSYNHIVNLGIDVNDTLPPSEPIVGGITPASNEVITSATPQKEYRPTAIILYRYGETTFTTANQYIGWNMFDNNPYNGNTVKPIYLKINLILPASYSVPSSNDKWSFGIRAFNDQYINRMIGNGTPFYGPDANSLFNVNNLSPSYEEISPIDGSISKFFDIIINDPSRFYIYHKLRIDDNLPDFSKWFLDCVLSNGFNDTSFRSEIIQTINRSNSEVSYIQPPYI
jgi:hypothetical protein